MQINLNLPSEVVIIANPHPACNNSADRSLSVQAGANLQAGYDDDHDDEASDSTEQLEYQLNQIVQSQQDLEEC
jgi:hypothetical protein